ncbi:hypothetical protein [Pseudomonas shirazensis]|uniref:hypothetical protein n=1 Tax=Pseudomonas shirazensis TaxID=2745494 RepID=UPI003D284CDC
MDQNISATYARSFRAKLYLQAHSKTIPLRLSQNNDKFSWGLSPDNDWLQAGGDAPSLIISFDYQSMTDNRLHYQVHIPGPRKNTPGPLVPRRLAISSNGYLGFYWTEEQSEHWKIEPLGESEEGLLCHLRDHQGHRVATVQDDPHFQPGWFAYLNVHEGDIATFLLKRVD